MVAKKAIRYLASLRCKWSRRIGVTVELNYRKLLFSSSVTLLKCLFFLFISVGFGSAERMALAQDANVQPTGVLRLKIKPKVDGKDKELSRKRFYLIKGTLEENKSLVERIKQQTFVSRECFYRSIKASEAFINWLKDGDCESVYCRSIAEQYLSGPAAVPEFQSAFKIGTQEYRTPDLARRWLTTNLPSELSDGYYRQKQAALKSLLSFAGTNAAPLMSVMSDRKGTAFFTDLSPATYLVSNLLPTELGANAVTWTCEVKVGTSEKRLQIPNLKDKNVKCIVVENPLPVCEANKQTASR